MRLRYCLWIFFFCVLSLSAWAQGHQPPQQQPPNPGPPPRGDVNAPIADDEDARNRIASDMQKRAAKERVAALKSDTDKLLKLSVELKNYVDKSDENVLSLDVIRKAEEIEKLAKSVREKMKGPN